MLIQKNKITLRLLLLSILFSMGLLLVGPANPSTAQNTGVPCDKKNITDAERVNCIPRLCDSNKLTAQQLESCKACNKLQPTLKECLQKNTIVKQLNIIVNFLSALVGIVIVGSLIWAGIQYTLGGDNSKQVTDAKQRIINTFIALIAFLFIAAFLQWLIPGGLFN